MDYICKKCNTEYNITEEYIKKYKDEGKRCGCGEIMELVPQKAIMEIRV